MKLNQTGCDLLAPPGAMGRPAIQHLLLLCCLLRPRALRVPSSENHSNPSPSVFGMICFYFNSSIANIQRCNECFNPSIASQSEDVTRLSSLLLR